MANINDTIRTIITHHSQEIMTGNGCGEYDYMNGIDLDEPEYIDDMVKDLAHANSITNIEVQIDLLNNILSTCHEDDYSTYENMITNLTAAKNNL